MLSPTLRQLADAYGHNISTTLNLNEQYFHTLDKQIVKLLLPVYNAGLRMLAHE